MAGSHQGVMGKIGCESTGVNCVPSGMTILCLSCDTIAVIKLWNANLYVKLGASRSSPAFKKSRRRLVAFGGHCLHLKKRKWHRCCCLNTPFNFNTHLLCAPLPASHYDFTVWDEMSDRKWRLFICLMIYEASHRRQFGRVAFITRAV